VKTYIIQLGGATAKVAITLKADSPEEAIAIVREELSKHRRPQDPVGQYAIEALAARGINLGDLHQKKLPEFGVEMPSAKFDSLSVMLDPAAITTANISASIDEDGTPHVHRR
jgi:hypothetical protein